MEPSDPFAKPQGWIITSWTPEKNGPPSLAPSGNILLIGIDRDDPSRYNAAWLDESLRWCFATSKLAPGDTGYTIELTHESEVTIKGDVSDFGEGNVGTIIAEAHPGEPPVSAEPGCPRWLWRLLQRRR